MKRHLRPGYLTAILIACLSVVSPRPTFANNVHLDETIRSFGDLSMFSQAMYNTGVENELRPDEHYTIFVPTNAAFASIQPQTYPCFYAVQCRPQVAGLLRNHIITGRHDLKDLESYGQGIQTAGGRRVHVEQPFVGQYTVDGRSILSKAEVDDNIVYRIDGVLAGPQDLSQFTATNYVTPEKTVTSQQTTTTYTSTIPSNSEPMQTWPSMPDRMSEKTTVMRTYTTGQ